MTASQTRRSPRLAALFASLALVCSLVLGTGTAQAAQVGTVSNAAAAAKLSCSITPVTTKADAQAKLAGLRVAADASMTGYSRTLFPHWRDASAWGWPVAPNNSCNARNAALYYDGDSVGMSSTCTNLTGTWVDPYSARVFNSASDIDIDHIVPLAEAWRSGAKPWSKEKKTQFANDPLVLASAWDSLNSAKGDKDPAVWVPPNTAAHCNYAKRWVMVKAKYGLTLGQAEKTKLGSMLGTCTA